MKTARVQPEPAVLVLIFNLCFCACSGPAELQVCRLCAGAALNGTAVGRFCSRAAGRIAGRCCVKFNNTSDPERVIGLDLSNCSLTRVEELQGASTALMIDLSLNPIVNISDAAFQGFIELNHMILPQDLLCPGGDASWEKVEVREGNRVCDGQKNTCNRTGQLPSKCPQNSLCGPYGPGLFQCSCADNYHGYKCLREGGFPSLRVFGPLGASTVVVAVLLWVTQRRKVKPL